MIKVKKRSSSIATGIARQPICCNDQTDLQRYWVKTGLKMCHVLHTWRVSNMKEQDT
jgi:hypothetical protein